MTQPTSKALHDLYAVSRGSSWKASGPQCFKIWATPMLCINRRSRSMANWKDNPSQPPRFAQGREEGGNRGILWDQSRWGRA